MAQLSRDGGEKGPEKAAYCLFMAVRAPVRRVMTGHYLFVVLSLWSREGPGLSVGKQFDTWLTLEMACCAFESQYKLTPS